MDRHAPLACLNTQMKRLIPSFLPAAVALCAVATLGGCAAYPYGGPPAGYGYNDGYYDGYGVPAFNIDQAPVAPGVTVPRFSLTLAKGSW